MNENKKARSDVAASEQADESSFEGSLIHTKHNTKINRFQDFLLEGEENALPMRVLAHQVGVSERQLRKLIERERGAGAFILSSDKGYYFPSPDCERYEICRYIHRADARMVTNRKTLRAMKDRLKELEAQENGQEILEL